MNVRKFKKLELWAVLLIFLISGNVFGSVSNVQVSGTSLTWFSDIYAEGTGLSKAQTMASYTQLRTGLNVGSTLETYALARLGGDTRTGLDPSNAIYNDNYVFFG